MATIGVVLRNEANTTDTLDVTGAFNVEFQKRRNADPGTGTFFLRKGDPASGTLTFNSLVRFVVTPDDAESPTVAFPARIIDIDPVNVSVGDEAIESIQYSCAGLLIDWERAVVQPSAVQVDLVPSMDERIWHWSSGEYNGIVGEDWDDAIPIAGQGWGSLFYTGQPAGWTDSAAFFMWGDPTESPDYDAGIHSDPTENAPAGRCLFWVAIPVEPGRKYIEWAADNFGVIYVNGRRMQEGSDFQKKQQLEIETTGTGFLTLAWEVVNSPDDGPPGGNPAGLIASMRKDDPATGDIVWRTTAPGLSTADLRVRSYPASELTSPVGRILRLAMEGNDVFGGLDFWSVGGTDTVDSDAVPYDEIDNLSFRFYDDTLLDVLKVLCQTWIDIRVETFTKTLRPHVKGTLANPAPVTLVTGYSTVGGADPSLVNVLDLKWNYTAPLFDRLALRWANGWLELGDGDHWGSYRAEQINDLATATAVGNRLLELYGVTRRTASITYLPLDETTDLPLATMGFDVGDTIDVPYADGDSYWADRTIESVTYTGDESGRVTAIVIEAGDPITDILDAFEESIRRGSPGQLGGRAAGGSATNGKAQFGNFDRYSVSSPKAGDTTHAVASIPRIGTAVSEGTVALPLVSVAPCLFVGKVVTLRLIGQGATGTSTVTVSDGVNNYVLSGTGEGRIAYVGADASWNTATELTVTVSAVGHENLHVYADVADVR